ncbi:hypothetical protein FKW77_003495 [Venturia effusa]|uniref:MARVEL domain-containing protein n=1 Tax=Venturia effusa TaxID=50376 RepID=A0A517L723_9PEZI|nr:hypothetical protein FKW77_003495 [Venturia effusa]
MLGALLARIDAKKALPRLHAAIQWLRIVEFACSIAIMGIFLSFSVNLPKGFTTSKRLVIVWALTIVAALYPILLWLSLMWFRRSKVLFIRVCRATDSFIAAPIIIALAIVLGDSGLPGKCTQLYTFPGVEAGNQTVVFSRIQACNANGTIDRFNECGTGRRQVKALNSMCQQAKAGFALTIAAIIVVYISIMIANLYLALKPHDSPTVSPSNSTRRANRNGSSPNPDMAQLPPQRDSLASTSEPPPPYTARPGQGESIAVAPTSHPAIDRVAASRAADFDVEGLAGAAAEDPCVDYETLDRTRSIMRSGAEIGIDLSTIDASSSPSNPSSSSTYTGPSSMLERIDSVRTLTTQPSILSLITTAEHTRRAIDSNSTTNLVAASASPGTSPRILQSMNSLVVPAANPIPGTATPTQPAHP